MKQITLFSAMFLTVVMFTSCIIQRPISNTPPSNNKSYEVSYLFEHDGCKVYRFYDNGNWVYFTNCKGEVTSIKADSSQAQTVTIVRTQP